jgi:hypothetical protein
LKNDAVDNKYDSPNKLDQHYALLSKHGATVNPDRTKNATQITGRAAGER